jgi:dienelactone hydrolase
MNKDLSKLLSRVSAFLIVSALTVSLMAQQPERPQRPMMRQMAPSLSQYYLQMENPLDPPAENWENPTGPYKVVMEVDETLPIHTIYRPADLSVFPGNDKLPIIVMSGPGCDFDGDSYRPFWTEIASYGYLVIAVGLPVPEGLRAAVFFNKDQDMLDGIDWAFAINKRAGSKYFGKIDTTHVVLMGQSCGGGHATRLRNDKRVTGLVYWNSGFTFLWDRKLGPNALIADPNPSEETASEALQRMTLPIAYFTGDTDMARQSGTADFEASDRNPTFLGVLEIPGDAHGGTFREKNGGQFGVAGVAWLNWWTKGDQEAALMFKGDPCGLANNKSWVELRGKNLDNVNQAQAPRRAPMFGDTSKPYADEGVFNADQMKAYRELRPAAENWAAPTGNYKVLMEVDKGLPEHTIYRPKDLSAFPERDKLPVIVMSGPGCDYDGDSYRPFWTELASHGYLIIAVGVPVPDGLRPTIGYSKPESMKKAVDWAISENTREGSAYFGKIDTKNIALMGQSCGGMLIYNNISSDPRITTAIFWNTGMMTRGEPSEDASAEYGRNIKIPVAFFVGGTDMARPAGLAGFEAVQKYGSYPAFYAVREIPGDAHGGTFREKNGGAYGVAGLAWIEWQMKGNKKAGKYFQGDPCPLAMDTDWIEVKKKDIE